MKKGDRSLEEAIAQEKGPLSQLVLKYTHVMKQLLDSAKNNPDFTAESWAPLAELVDVENFERVGTFKEVVNWKEYAQLLTQWARAAEWYPRVRRITERPGLVFLELAEDYDHSGMKESIFSTSVYEFNENNKLRHLDIYMQREQIPFAQGSWDVEKA